MCKPAFNLVFRALPEYVLDLWPKSVFRSCMYINDAGVIRSCFSCPEKLWPGRRLVVRDEGIEEGHAQD